MHLRRKKTLMDRAHEYVDTVIPQLEAAVGTAVEKAGPALTDARDRARPLIAEGKALAAEKAAAGASIAADKAALGRDLAAAKVAELKGVEPEPQRSTFKTLMLLGGVAALGALVFSKVRGSQKDSANWQSSYVPKPAPSGPSSTTNRTPTTGAPTSPSSTTPRVTDDIGGGAPGEAISDSIEEPQAATSPDNPADVIDINDVPGSDSDTSGSAKPSDQA